MSICIYYKFGVQILGPIPQIRRYVKNSNST